MENVEMILAQFNTWLFGHCNSWPLQMMLKV